ncbi:MAG: PAS domain S-box protein, partial [Candidatus Thorarchaeota archaeon]
SMKASDQRYQELMENVPGGVAIADNDNRFIYVNPAFLRILQYDRDEIIGMSVFDTIIPEHHNKLKDESQKRSGGVSSTYDVTMLTKYGERRTTTLSAVPYRDDGGQVIGSIGLFIDNTERNLALEALSKSEQHYHELIENVPGGVAIADNDNRFIYVNPAFLTILQYEKDEIIGMSVFDTIIPEHHNKTIDESQKRRGGVSSAYDVTMITKYGERRTTTLSAVPQRDENGQIIGSIGLFIDNTERNLALEALSKSEQHYRELISQLPVGVALVTPDERLELVNEALATILGVPLEDLHMKRFTDFMDQHAIEKILHQTKTRQLGHSSVYEVDITQPSGNRRTLRISAAPNKNDEDVIVGTLGIMEDITIQKRNEQIRLLQEKEIELYETLLMHDLRNDLAIVVSYVEAVQLITQLDDEPAVFMKSAVATIMRISNLLSGFGRPQELKERNLLQYLQFLADEAVEAYEQLTMNIESTENAYDMNIAAGTLLSLVFQNLIRNTVQHVEDSPEIEIDIKRKQNMAQIIIRDNGTGIPPQIRSQLFQRGVSTKGESGGLGLHLCKEILTSKGGSIKLLPPEEGQGAAFLIEIPILS